MWVILAWVILPKEIGNRPVMSLMTREKTGTSREKTGKKQGQAGTKQGQ